ncbi:MAG: Gfo/Idh/MocA family oxidoreductase, partial [Planctomycetota bacterium]
TIDSNYQSILDRDDIKIVHVATPDHWHTKPVVEAMLAGKDIYCEKPLTLTIDEGKLIRKIQKQTGRVIQVGTQQRSQFRLFTKAIAIAAEGRLGKIKKLQCAIGGAPVSDAIPVAEVPKELDWDVWLGPAPKVDFRWANKEWTDKEGKKRTTRRNNNHYEFRWWYEYSGGKLTDWGAHHVDIAMWALRAAGQSTNIVSIEGTAEHPVEFKDGVPVQTDRYNTANKFNFTAQTDEGTEIVIRHDTGNGCLIEGDKGRIFVNRGKLTGKPVEDLAENPLPEDALAKVYKNLPMERGERQGHWLNFLHCHKQGIEPISDVHSHMEMLNLCHLAGIAARLGRKLKWNPTTESIIGDDQANAMLSRPYRDGYEIEM